MEDEIETEEQRKDREVKARMFLGSTLQSINESNRKREEKIQKEEEERLRVEESAKQERQQKIEETLELLKGEKLQEIIEEIYPLQKQIEESAKRISKIRREKIEYGKLARERLDMFLDAKLEEFIDRAFSKRDKEFEEIREFHEETEQLFDSIIEKLKKIAKKS